MYPVVGFEGWPFIALGKKAGGQGDFMDKLRVGVIGAGGHAQVHFEMIAHEPEMDLVAVAEINPERLAKAQEMYAPVQ